MDSRNDLKLEKCLIEKERYKEKYEKIIDEKKHKVREAIKSNDANTKTLYRMKVQAEKDPDFNPTTKLHNCKLCDAILVNGIDPTRIIYYNNKECTKCNNSFCFNEKTFTTTFSLSEDYECYDIHKPLCKIKKKIENLKKKIPIKKQ